MAKAKKVLLKTGKYKAPQGELHATRPYLRRLVDNFKKMSALGIKVPVCWGHQKKAKPADKDEQANEQFYKSRFNAGYLDDLNLQGDDLALTLDCPGLQLDDAGHLLSVAETDDGVAVQTAIKEVSGAIKDRWVDGQGRTWQDALLHVALTPLPVVADQGGFTALNTGEFTLSLITLGDDDVADKEDKAPDTSGDGPSMESKFKAVLEKLAEKYQINLPDDTTPENAWERLEIALMQGEPAEAEPEPTEANEEMEEGGEIAAEPESRPVMLSLANATDPMTIKLLSTQQESKRTELKRQIKSLQKRGMPRLTAEKLEATAAGYELSLNEAGEPVQADVEYRLSVWDEYLPKKALTTEHLKAGARPVQRPVDVDEGVSPEEIKSRAAAVSVTRAKR